MTKAFRRPLVAVPLVLALTVADRAHAGDDVAPREGSGPWSPGVTLRLGAVLPVFVIYEFPGPMAGVTLGWRVSERTQVVARGELGALFFQGAQRYLGTLGAGARFSPVPRWVVSPWVQLGLGATGYLERISIELPERAVRSTDLGGLLVANLSIGTRIAQRWEFGVGWDHIVWPLPYYNVYKGSESLPYRGNIMAWLGVQL